MIIAVFIAFFKIGILTIGGAYSFLPVIEREVVDKCSWLTKSEFLDIMGITQLFPGAISVKYATYTGYKVAGVPGVIAANIGVMLPPAIIMMSVILLYKNLKSNPSFSGALKMIRTAVFSMIIVVAFQLIGLKTLANLRTAFTAVVFLVLFAVLNIHPAFIIIGAGILGALIK